MRSKIPRREFIMKCMQGSIFASLFTSSGFMVSCKRPSLPLDSNHNIFMSGDKPLLVILRGKNAVSQLKKGLSIFMEAGKKYLKGDRLFLKPNATTNEPYPVTTDPLMLKKLVGFFKDHNYRNITIGDNPSYRGIIIKKIFKDRGYFKLKEERVKVLPKDPGIGYNFRKVTRNEWKVNPIIMVNKDILAADLVINTAIPKRHHAADFTCALKNNFGSVYDPIRTQAHIKMEIDKVNGQDFFDRTIVECADAARPQITVVDARSILIKSGPGFYAGGEIRDSVNEIIISGDMVATDSYCAELMKRYDSSFNPDLRVKKRFQYAQSLGLGKSDLSHMEIVEIES